MIDNVIRKCNGLCICALRLGDIQKIVIKIKLYVSKYLDMTTIPSLLKRVRIEIQIILL